MFDPLAGNGSTLIAAEPLDGARDRQMGRRAFLMEIDALYPSTSPFGLEPFGLELRAERLRAERLRAVSPSTQLGTMSLSNGLSNRCDVIVQRWEQLTGRKAKRQKTG